MRGQGVGLDGAGRAEAGQDRAGQGRGRGVAAGQKKGSPEGEPVWSLKGSYPRSSSSDRRSAIMPS